MAGCVQAGVEVPGFRVDGLGDGGVEEGWKFGRGGGGEVSDVQDLAGVGD